MMEFLTQIVEAGRQNLPRTQHEDFMLALKHSLTVDPLTYTPQSFDPYGFTQRELYNLKVLLLRPLAYDFVQALGVEMRKSTFDRLTGYDAYEAKFGRAPWLISVKPRIMLLTFTEWLELAGVSVPVPLPDALAFDEMSSG